MSCAVTFRNGAWPGDAFAFGDRLDAATRGVEMMQTLWVAPWRAWWALTLEALEPGNYRF